MKNIFLILAVLFASLNLSAQDWPNYGRYAKSNSEITKPVKVAFMGNSITDNWGSQRPDFFKSNNFAARGISGQTSYQMLIRFRPDVIDLKPKAVAILCGTNDIAKNNGDISLEHVLGNIISMCELAKANKIKVLLCSVLPVYQYPWRKEIDAVPQIAKLNEMLKEYASKNKNVVYVDYFSAMADERKGLPQNLAGDGVHPNAAGYEIMEGIILNAIKKNVK
ncbi:MAG: GDSL-type esterase/lipase family protein [Bacteroidales bacterium]|nr:GDSL-type esterase/lipase family protein [Bacteroidales bacterium]